MEPNPDWPIGKIKLTVTPSIKDGCIVLDTTIETALGKQVIREIANLKEQAVRAALIKLGWTPPAFVDESAEDSWRKLIDKLS